MPAAGTSAPVTRGAVVALVTALASIYLVSQFLRNSVGVIAPNLAQEIGLNATEIGLLSSVFFFSFAAAQLPLGVAIDRYGPKACMLVCAAIAFIGTLAFAAATTPSGMVTARVLMGLGSSCYLMAPLAVYARRFPPERFTVLAGIQIGIGTVGTLLVTAPLAWATATIGWRATFLTVAGLVVLFAGLVALVVQDGHKEGRGSTPPETVRESLAGIPEVTRLPSFWPLFVMHVSCYSGYVLIVGLWGGPYLTHIYGFGLTQRGDLLLIPAVTQIIGVVVWGHAERFVGAYKPMVLTGGLLSAAALGAFAVFDKMSPAGLMVLLAVFGFVTAYLPVLITHGRASLPSRLTGRGMTLFNMGTIGGVFVSQIITGRLMDLFPAPGGVYPLAAYQTVFGVQAVFGAMACVAYMFAREMAPGAAASPESHTR